MKKSTWEEYPFLEPEDRPAWTWKDAIAVPDHPPFPRINLSEDPKEAAATIAWARNTRKPSCLAWHLIDGAWHLVTLSRMHAGRFAEGMALPELSIAASAGAITLACAAFEAALDETATILGRQAADVGLSGRARSFEMTRSLSPRERIEAILALCEQPFGWDREPFQSLGLVLAVRRHLLHHETTLDPYYDGHWPAKKLRELSQRLRSPYLRNPGLDWHQHVLTPDGSEWAVRSMYAVLGVLDLLWHDLPEEVREAEAKGFVTIGTDAVERGGSKRSR